MFGKFAVWIGDLMVRVDPDKITPLKNEAASEADLKAGFNPAG